VNGRDSPSRFIIGKGLVFTADEGRTELAYRATTLLVENAETQLAGESVQAAFVGISRHTSGSRRSYYPGSKASTSCSPKLAVKTRIPMRRIFRAV
jgi:hypothetical protein